jgi:hypothetical protein
LWRKLAVAERILQTVCDKLIGDELVSSQHRRRTGLSGSPCVIGVPLLIMAYKSSSKRQFDGGKTLNKLIGYMRFPSGNKQQRGYRQRILSVSLSILLEKLVTFPSFKSCDACCEIAIP